MADLDDEHDEEFTWAGLNKHVDMIQENPIEVFTVLNHRQLDEIERLIREIKPIDYDPTTKTYKPI